MAFRLNASLSASRRALAYRTPETPTSHHSPSLHVPFAFPFSFHAVTSIVFTEPFARGGIIYLTYFYHLSRSCAALRCSTAPRVSPPINASTLMARVTTRLLHFSSLQLQSSLHESMASRQYGKGMFREAVLPIRSLTMPGSLPRSGTNQT